MVRFSSVEYILKYFYVCIEFCNQYEAVPPQGHLVEEYFGNPDTNKTLEIQAAFIAESESFSSKM